MIDKSNDSVQAIQQILGRTHFGRKLSDRSLQAVSSWRKNINTDYGKTECSLCGLILKSNYFIEGCPNCGSTDNRPVS